MVHRPASTAVVTLSRPALGWLAFLALAAFALRLAVVIALAGPHDRPLGYEHGRIAENLLAGRGFTIEFLGSEGPTSQQAPFYPFLLAGSYLLFGVNTPASIVAVQILQCLAGTLLVLLVVTMAWLALPKHREIGWAAGVAAAVYPTHLYTVTHLQVALWAALDLAGLVTFTLAFIRMRQARYLVAAGAVGGILLLTEPILAIALPCCAAAVWLPARWSARALAGERFWHRCGRVAVMAGVTAAVISPWMVRNRIVHGEWVFIKDTFGYAFWQANNAASFGTDKIPKPSAETLRQTHDGSLAGMDRALWEARHETLYIDDVLLKPGGYREFRGLSEPERSRVLGRRAYAFIATEPGAYLRLCANRLRYFLAFDETNPKAANRLYRVATAVWLVLTAVGTLAAWPHRRQLWLTFVLFAAVTLFHTLVITSVRFRIPIEPLSFVWIGAAIGPLAVRLSESMRKAVAGSRVGSKPAELAKA